MYQAEAAPAAFSLQSTWRQCRLQVQDGQSKAPTLEVGTPVLDQMTQYFLSGNRDLLLQFLTRVRHSEQKVQLDVSEKRVCVRRPCCLKTKAQVLERLGAEMALVHF